MFVLRKIVVSTAFVLILLPQLKLAQAQNTAIDKVIAIVANEPVTLSEYRTRHRQEILEGRLSTAFNGQIDRVLLESIISEKIQIQQADRRGIEVSEGEVDNAVGFISKQNNTTVQGLIAQLERDDFSYRQFRDSLKKQQKIRKLIDAVANSRVVISEQEIENYVNTHEELTNTDVTFEVSHLFIRTKGKTAQQIEADAQNAAYIRGQLIDGEDFADTVDKFSDANNSEPGGYLGWRTANQLPEVFIQSLRKLNPETNPISAVLRSDNGLHILKLHDRKGSGDVVKQQQIRHILIKPDNQNTIQDAEELANNLYQQLQAGESFEKLARLYSDDAGSKTKGGALGWVSPGVMVPEFEQAALSLAVNTVSAPVRSRFGYHLIEVLDRRESDATKELADDKARQAIFRRKSEDLFTNWLQSIRQQTFVEYVD